VSGEKTTLEVRREWAVRLLGGIGIDCAWGGLEENKTGGRVAKGGKKVKTLKGPRQASTSLIILHGGGKKKNQGKKLSFLTWGAT